MKPDFSDLYFQLGLRPDCGLEDLKRAYHRRVARLHPDRPDAQSTTPTELPLADLMALYGAATRFHRRYGRLPGAPSKPSSARPAATRRRQTDLAFASPDARSMPFQPLLMLAAIAVGVMAGLGWAWNGSIEDWLQRTIERRMTAPTSAPPPPVVSSVSTAQGSIDPAATQVHFHLSLEGLLGTPPAITQDVPLPAPTRPADADCLLHATPPRY